MPLVCKRHSGLSSPQLSWCPRRRLLDCLPEHIILFNDRLYTADLSADGYGVVGDCVFVVFVVPAGVESGVDQPTSVQVTTEPGHHRTGLEHSTEWRSDRFMRRGLGACQAEWKLIATTHNLLKLWRAELAHAQAITAPLPS